MHRGHETASDGCLWSTMTMPLRLASNSKSNRKIEDCGSIQSKRIIERINIVGKGDVLDHLSLAKIRAPISCNISVDVIVEVRIGRVDLYGYLVCQLCCSEMNLSVVSVYGCTYLNH